MSDVEFVFKTHSSVMPIQTIEVSHPSFSKTHRLVANVAAGKMLDGKFYDYVPLSIPQSGVDNTLDQQISIEMADVGLILGEEIEAAWRNGTVSTPPQLTVRLWRGDTLEEITEYADSYDILTTDYDGEGVAITAGLPSLNIRKTGVSYEIVNFPTIKGALLG